MAVLSEGQGTPHTRRRLLVELFSDWPFFFTYFSFSPKSGSCGGKQKAACEYFMSCMAWHKPVSAGAMISASRGPHPQGDTVESDTPGSDIELPLANCGDVT